MRLIDADKLLELIKEQKEREIGAYAKGVNAGLNIVKSIINDETQTPTAFDVDKVVEQLKERSMLPRPIGMVPLKEAIEIVKADVDTENNHNKEIYFTALEDYHRLISEECKFMLIKCNPYALHLKEYNDKVLEQLKAGGNY
jgi:hypothetical protein|nr:MAG TPA: hypothetical protein [Caudoviricetes sp.]